MFDLTATALAALTGSVLSLFFAYFPWVKDWFDTLDPKVKPLLMAFMLLLVAWGYLAAKCDFNWNCISVNAEQVFLVWFAALLGNQVTFPVAVKQFKKGK